MLKRIGLFLLTNIAVLAVIMTITSLFGLDTTYLKPHGLDLTALAIMSLLWGMVGSVISLLMSRWMAKRSVGVVLIKNPATPTERFLYETIQRLASQNNITMPEVGIYPAPEANAFATGATKNKSLVAVSSGLIDQMSKEEIEGVLAHEMTHIVNGDMVTMTLLQGVMNAFVIFFSRIAAYAVQGFIKDGEKLGGFAYFITSIVFQILFGILASLVVNYFSRTREFAADKGSAHMVGKNKMIAALKRLQVMQGHITNANQNKSLATMQINGNRGGFMNLFRTHPPLEARIESLMKS